MTRENSQGNAETPKERAERIKAQRMANLKPLKKGETLPGGGRPKTPEAVKEILRAATPEAAAALAEIVSDKTKKASDRIKAAEIILDRVLGKAVQPIDANIRHTWDDLSDDELNRRLLRFGLLSQTVNIIDIEPENSKQK